MKQLMIFFIVIFFICCSSCKDKPATIDSHNRSLVNIPIDELKTILSGNWLLKKETTCGIVACRDTLYPLGQEDVFSFLQQDSIKRTKANGIVLVYDKASICKTTTDNYWLYTMYGGLVSWSFHEIKNDTLLYSSGGLGFIGYLVKKP